MVTAPPISTSILSLPRVAAFAGFIVAHHLSEYAHSYMEALADVGIDINNYFPADETKTLEEQFIYFAEQHLQLLADDKASLQIEQTLQSMLPDGGETLEELENRLAYLLQIGYLRKKVFKAFLPLYTTSVSEALEIIEEVDKYSLVSEKATYEAYLHNISQLLQLREEQLLEAQELSGTGSYIWFVKSGVGQATPQLLRMLCINSSTEIRKHLASIHADDIEDVKTKIRAAISTFSHYELHYRFQHEGKERIILTKGKVETGIDGPIIKGTVMDITEDEELVHRLEESRRLYKEAQELARIGSWSWDINTGSVKWSDEVYNICEVSREENIQLPDLLKTLVGPVDWQALRRQLNRIKHTGKPIFHIGKIRLRSGVQKILELKGKVANNGSSKSPQIIGTIQDVTNEQGLIHRLQDTERRYRHMEAIAHIGNWVINIDTNKAEVTDEFRRIYELESSTKHPTIAEIRSFMKQEDRRALDVLIAACIKDGTPYEYECNIVTKSGAEKTILARGEAIKDTTGRVHRIAGTAQDITQRKKVERQLREHQRFTQKITDIAPSIIGVYNINTGKYAFISLAIEKILGYNREEIMEKGAGYLMTMMHPDDMATIIEENTAAINRANNPDRGDAPEEIVEFKYRMKHIDGSWHWFQTFGTVFERDEHGMVLQVLNVSLDISGEKQAELTLNHKNMLLQQSNSSLEEFAYIASHDLQEPLRKISTFGNMLETLQEEALSENGKLYLRKIVDSAIRMQQMISDVLSVSIISGNRLFQTESLQEILDEVRVTLEHKIDETKAVIEVVKPLPNAKVIASQFRQLFQNLIGNSLKFSRSSVQPVIRISYDYITGDIANSLNLDKDKRYLRLIFTDNGIGFSNNYASKIFAIFQRLHGKSEYEGTGIGLAVCKKIVEHHNGIIFANGAPDEGATFTIIIPS